MADSQDTIDGADDTNRLHDILVQEVSLVDRAANKRKFLMLKRGNEMADQTVGAEVVEDENGDLTAIDETNKATIALQSEAKAEILQVATKALSLVTNASALIKGADDDTDAQGIPADIAKELDEARTILFSISEKYASVDDEAKKGIAPTDKASTIRMATESLERLVAIVAVVEGADGVEKSDDGVPTEITGELMAVARLVSGLIERYAPEPEAAPTPAEKSAPTWRDAREVAPVTKGTSTLEALAKAAAAIKPVEKAGRKMAGDRLTKLRSIAKELIELLREVSPDDFDEVVAASAERAEKSDAPKGGEVDPEKPETDVVAKGEITTQLLTEANDALAKANAEIIRLRKSFDLPNSMTDEVVSTPEAPSNDTVAWPADMNKPVTKESVKKGHWFDAEA